MRKPPTVAEAIRARMGDRTQVAVAREMRVTQARLSRWLGEDVDPPADALEKIQRWLGLRSVYDLGPMIVATKLRALELKRLARGLPPEPQ